VWVAGGLDRRALRQSALPQGADAGVRSPVTSGRACGWGGGAAFYAAAGGAAGSLRRNGAGSRAPPSWGEAHSSLAAVRGRAAPH
jgi:hypothetical protein